MNVSKHEIIEILDNLPEIFDSEELHFALFLLDKIKHAEADIANGDMCEFEVISERAEEWLKH